MRLSSEIAIVFRWMSIAMVLGGIGTAIEATAGDSAHPATRDLRIGRTNLHWPVDLPFKTYPEGKPTTEGVDEIKTYLKFPELLGSPPPTLTEYDGLVRVEILARGHEVPREWDQMESRGAWEEAAHSDIEGLRKYQFHPKNGGHPDIRYVSVDEKDRTPKGSRIRFICQDDQNGAVSRCWSSWQHSGGLMVTYVISGKLLPHWRKVQRGVVQFVDSLVNRP